MSHGCPLCPHPHSNINLSREEGTNSAARRVSKRVVWGDRRRISQGEIKLQVPGEGSEQGVQTECRGIGRGEELLEEGPGNVQHRNIALSRGSSSGDTANPQTA